MSKQISKEDLATLVGTLLTNPESIGQLEEHQQFASFMTDIAEVVCNHCGGEMISTADDFAGEWLLGIIKNDSLPEDGGVWKDFDKEGNL